MTLDIDDASQSPAATSLLKGVSAHTPRRTRRRTDDATGRIHNERDEKSSWAPKPLVQS